MAKKVKIKDIAAKLGLSSTLVSMVLNNKADKHGIKTETQKRVVALATRMGYFENAKIDATKDIAEVGPGIIGMVVHSLKDPFIAEISDHLRKAFASLGYGFSIITWDKRDNRYKRVASNLRRIFSGVILAGDAADDDLIRVLKTSDFPFVILEKSNVNLRLNIVRTDCQAGAVKLGSHLKGFDYSSIVIVHPEQTDAYTEDKIKCTLNLLRKELDTAVIQQLSLKLDVTGSIEVDEIKALLKSPSRPDLLIVSDSSLVYPLIQSLNDIRVRIPQDLALISLEDGIGFDLFSTALTRLKRDVASIASKAVSILWTEIKNSGKSKHKRAVSLAPELIVRKSCGTL